jgi:hypothetical protein
MPQKFGPITDMAGNEIVEGIVVHVVPKFPILFKVAKVVNGGIMTPQGPSPAVVQFVTEFVLAQPPGTKFANVIKVAMPGDEKALTSISDLLGKA